MDIIKVTKDNLKARLAEHAFEINSCLSRADDKGILDEFSKSITKYSLCSLQLQVINSLESQVNEDGPKDEGKN